MRRHFLLSVFWPSAAFEPLMFLQLGLTEYTWNANTAQAEAGDQPGLCAYLTNKNTFMIDY